MKPNIGVQCDDGDEFEGDADFCFCDDGRRGRGYHCGGFLKHRASFTRFGWKFGARDTVGVARSMALHIRCRSRSMGSAAALRTEMSV